MAAAVEAGYEVTSIDGFADQQTVELAHVAILVAYDEYGFNATALLGEIAKLDATQYLGFVYGSGFEAQPDLLEAISGTIPLIGNVPSSVKAVKTPARFFATLKLANIAHPKTYLQPTMELLAGYLQKFSGGCGGTHIKIVTDKVSRFESNRYYQEKIDGQPVSLLFLACTNKIAPVGFNEQWISSTTAMPFRYGGAVSQIKLNLSLQQQMIEAAKVLTQQFNLVGLNSLDGIVQDDIFYVLEINPRLSASFDLYATHSVERNLMDLHIQASLDDEALLTMDIKFVPVIPISKACVVIYAIEDMVISTKFTWPDWVVDCPYSQQKNDDIRLLAGQPICSVVAQADDAGVAKEIVDTRAEVINNLLKIVLKRDEYASLL
ncbi:COG2232 Predicted ATP-dependent carboligase related to biotin carboxylase [Methylophilaceae bacterium]